MSGGAAAPPRDARRSRGVARRTPSPSTPSSSAGSPSKTHTTAARVPSHKLRHLVLSVVPGTRPRLLFTASQEVVPRFPPVQVAEGSRRAFSRGFFFFVNYLYTRLPGLRRPVFWDAGRRCFGSASETRRGPRVSFRAFVVCERVCRPLGCSVLEKMEARKDAATENWRSGLLEADVVRRGFAAAQGCRWNRTRVEIITPGELTFKCLS